MCWKVLDLSCSQQTQNDGTGVTGATIPLFCILMNNTSTGSSDLSFNCSWKYCTSYFPRSRQTIKSPEEGSESASEETTFTNYEIIQPKYEFVDLLIPLCGNCAQLFDSSLIVSAPTSLELAMTNNTTMASVAAGTNNNMVMLPHLLAAFQCQSKKLMEMGMVSSEMAQTVLLRNPSEEATKGQDDEEEEMLNQLFKMIDHPYQLYFKRVLYQDSLEQQRRQLALAPPASVMLGLQQQRQQFLARMHNGLQVIQTYEDPVQQRKVLQFIDFPKIYEHYQELVAAEQQQQQQLQQLPATSSDGSQPAPPPPPPPAEKKTLDELFFLALMRWFKVDFFKWTNKPLCDHCPEGKPPHMECIGMDGPNPVEKLQGWASRIECYKCSLCQQITRFPRYNNPSYMMECSRRGRCGEFANVFGMICRSLGFDVNYVLDWTDHVWIEVWNPALQSYVHMDCCERAYNSPLMYEVGWNKQLTHIFAFNRFHIYNSTSRYSRDLEAVILRRNMEVLPECEVLKLLEVKNKELEQKYLHKQQAATALPVPQEQHPFEQISLADRLAIGKEGFENLNVSYELPYSEIVHRQKKNQLDLAHLSFYSQKKTMKAEEMRGRISGDLAWKKARGEAGGVIAGEEMLETRLPAPVEECTAERESCL